MFRGDQPELRRVLSRAMTHARDLGHYRVGGEHLLLALTTAGCDVSTVLTEHGATAAAIGEAVSLAAPAGAGAAADREALATLGVDLDRLLAVSGPGLLDQPPAREPLLPFGAAKARRRCAQLSPPLGLDAQAIYEASLRTGRSTNAALGSRGGIPTPASQRAHARRTAARSTHAAPSHRAALPAHNRAHRHRRKHRGRIDHQLRLRS
ncbi:hypothetical protein Ais01nite_73320 [Asanoa ishikariensis]|nr:hypothetical protein Ais01nite_73320 [Asanoa ishikariensis]